MTKQVLYSSLLAIILGTFVLSGCNKTQPATSSESNSKTESATEMKTQDSVKGTETQLSTSTEVDDIQKDLSNTAIGTEDFSDL